MFTFESYEDGGVLFVVLEVAKDAWDDQQASSRAALYRTIETHPDPRFALDLGAIDFLASSDIGFLISLKRRIDSRQGKVVLFDVDSYLLDSPLRLHQFFTIAQDRPDALARLTRANS